MSDPTERTAPHYPTYDFDLQKIKAHSKGLEYPEQLFYLANVLKQYDELDDDDDDELADGYVEEDLSAGAALERPFWNEATYDELRDLLLDAWTPMLDQLLYAPDDLPRMLNIIVRELSPTARGRKPRYVNAAQFTEDAIKAHLTLVKQSRSNDRWEDQYHYSQESIAYEMGFKSVEGWRKRARALGLDLDQLKADALFTERHLPKAN